MLWFMLANKYYTKSAFVPPAIIGLLAAIGTCIFREFFIFSSYLYTEDMGATYLHLLTKDTLIPVAALCLFFFLFSKDDWLYKSDAIFPLLEGFYAAYLPYTIMSGRERHAVFLTFIKPLLFIAMPLILSTLANSACRSIYNRKKVLAAIKLVGALVPLFIPALCETMWFYNEVPTYYRVPCAVLCILAATLHIIVRELGAKTEAKASEAEESPESESNI